MSSSIHTPTMTNIEEHSPSSASLTIAPLYAGYGHTLGNSIRRVALASTSGAAITGFKVDGASHEFTTIEGIKEDVVQIIQNLKLVRFRCHVEEPVTISIDKQVSDVITAGDFQTGSEVEIVNADQVIATVAKKMPFKMSVVIEVDRGYRTADEQANLPSDFIKIDSIFSPVTRVRYKVQATRVGQNTDLDEVIVTIDTDGSVTPTEAFEEANAILVTQYQSLAGSTTVASAGTLTKKLEEGESENEMTTPIEDLTLSPRTTNALVNNDIRTVGDLVGLSNTELKELKGFGSKAFDEVKVKLAELEVA